MKSTYVYIFITFTVNPGYLPAKYKTPKTSKGYAPCALLRIYNMRLWMANDIYTFDEFSGERHADLEGGDLQNEADSEVRDILLGSEASTTESGDVEMKEITQAVPKKSYDGE